MSRAVSHVSASGEHDSADTPSVVLGPYAHDVDLGGVGRVRDEGQDPDVAVFE